MIRAFLSSAAIICLYVNNAAAWERTGEANCEKAYKSCRRSENQCKKEHESCLQKAPAADLASFQYALTPHVKSIFVKLSDDRKKQAMDLADRNQMSPNDAVAEVASQCICPQQQ